MLLDLPGVQENLSQLSPEAQWAELRELRKDMGMDEAALDRMEALDQQRAAMREKGNRYEAESQFLRDSLPPEQLATELHNLRIEIFGESEAQIILNEEDMDYYRFREPQKIGVN